MATASPRKRSATSLRGMRVSHVRLSNWRNFKVADVELQQRMFLVGPNASGKSNFLDVFRFLRDIARPGGGLQDAVERGGVSKIRYAGARPGAVIEIEVSNGDTGHGDAWTYHLSFSEGDVHHPLVRSERVTLNGEVILDRPTSDDRSDPARLAQTHLEQVAMNSAFRMIASCFERIAYLHVVPELIRHPERFHSTPLEPDPYGSDLLPRIAAAPERTRNSRIATIREALCLAVPQVESLDFFRDQRDAPHLSMTSGHWRPNTRQMTEDQFSDGTLRLIGLLWALMDGHGVLLLEEPELSLHSSIVRLIPSVMYRLTRQSRRQVLIATHSAEMLSDESIGSGEILMLIPGEHGTSIFSAGSDMVIRCLMEQGMPASEAVVPVTALGNYSPAELRRW